MRNRKLDDPDYFTITAEFAEFAFFFFFFYLPPLFLAWHAAIPRYRPDSGRWMSQLPQKVSWRHLGEEKIQSFLLERFFSLFSFSLSLFLFFIYLIKFWSTCFARILIKSKKEKRRKKQPKPKNAPANHLAGSSLVDISTVSLLATHTLQRVT